MAIKTNSAGIITHNSEVFSERGRSFGLAALKNSPLGIRPDVVVPPVPPAPSTLGDYIYDNKSPTILYDYATLFNRGSHYNGVGVVLIDTAHIIDDSYQGLSGYLESQRFSISESGKAFIDTIYGMKTIFNRSKDRSYLFVLSSSAMNIPDYDGPFPNGYRNIVEGLRGFNGNYIAGSFYETRGSATFGIAYGPTAFKTSYSHTDGGSSETIVSATATDIFLFLVSYNSSSKELTYRWKQFGHRAGHSFYTETKGTTTNSGAGTFYLIGHQDAEGGSVRVHLNAVYDSQTTEEEFDHYASLLGL